jgi:Ca-activated chloride channel family protein
MSGALLAHPWLFAAALAALALVEWARRRRAPRSGVPFADAAWLAGLPRSGRDRLARAWPLLRLAVLALFALALADPAVERRASEEQRRGVDVLVALDVSSSMTAVLPGSFASRRFDAARAAIVRFIEGRPDDRFALTAFAKFPRLRCPTTWDHALLAAQLAATTTAEGEEDYTAIGVALADGAVRLAAAEGRSRVLVLVTDGANNSGSIEPMEAVELCRAEGVRVYVIAIGGGEEFGSGRPPGDRELLERIGARTGGAAFTASDEAALAAAWRTIDALERSPTVKREGIALQPLATGVTVAVAALLLALFAGERVALRSLP